MFKQFSGGFSYGFGADFAAASYFESLPLEVKKAVNEHAGEIHSIEDLRRFAENRIGLSDTV